MSELNPKPISHLMAMPRPVPLTQNQIKKNFFNMQDSIMSAFDQSDDIEEIQMSVVEHLDAFLNALMEGKKPKKTLTQKEIEELCNDIEKMQEQCPLTPKQLAKHLGLSEKTLLSWRAMGTGPKFTRLPSRGIRYRPKDVNEWQESRSRNKRKPEREED